MSLLRKRLSYSWTIVRAIGPPSALVRSSGSAEGSLLTRSTVDTYVAAVIELLRLQLAHSNVNTENPRGAILRGFLKQQGLLRGRHDRAFFESRRSNLTHTSCVD